MNYRTQEVENGTLIKVEADEAAVIVKENGEERIYLPSTSHNDSTYYTSDTKSLQQSQQGFSVVHNGQPDSIKVFSTQEN
ncbi:hypothetical protein [Candidatus Nanohalobium constans]|uniref:Uncharacterized protein n=1 Tax=Candidatus Nanohalobium constans TaxID=2565781 RepID=A0A5Q0UFR8_9ARCH|nr:hypothetical protein [Candidatus Nanohalobium constans]QGA80040.1 hypothetical protein LC1Nh_0132 [Candidatus Nanohalobium constans]